METIIPGAPPKGTYDVNLTTHHDILFAPINASSSGDNTLVAADTVGRRIKVLSYVFIAGGTVNVTFKSDSTALTGTMPMVVNAGIACPPSSPAQGPYMATAANEALILNLSDAIAVTGHLSYYLE